ncbi:UNVERIFIED_CONTAM: Endoglucanase 24 [Sesamum calycinum]|uniref:Endoglucanase n=1 Tax=Sesamum calycinum TaxID=2727403 RepID=A0AAW2PKB4_9LAMI
MKLYYTHFLLLLSQFPFFAVSYHDYADALSKSIMFFEGQRSGYLPADQRLTWRGNSGLGDGWMVSQDLTGGYYDAGDNVKFNFPMAFTTTMLAWSVVEFGECMPPAELRSALVAIRWATDYLLKTVSQPNRIFVQVPDPWSIEFVCLSPVNLFLLSHLSLPNLMVEKYTITVPNLRESSFLYELSYAQLLEPFLVTLTIWLEIRLMTITVGKGQRIWTARTVYTVDAPNPASDVAGETAAALAASSIAFRSSDPGYAETLFRTATRVFEFADSYRGAYSDNSNIRDGVCPFYCDFGYQTEELWGAAWLRRASQDNSYLDYLQNNGKTLGADDNINEFGWDNKHAGLNVLVSKEVLVSSMYSLQSYRASADSFMCTLIPESSSYHIEFTPGASFTGGVNYILGENPKGMSYMVGYSNLYPQRIHHRGSSLPSTKDHPQVIGCKEGSIYFNSSDPNPNVLVGAIVGGPGEDDEYEDDRADFRKSEPTTYINAPFVGVLAFFVANPNP